MTDYFQAVADRAGDTLGVDKARRFSGLSGYRKVVYQYANGVIHNHFGQALTNTSEGDLRVHCHGPIAQAQINYWGKAFLRGGPQQFNGGAIDNLYDNGAARNIASFHQLITGGNFANETVRRAVDGCLACILGRETVERHGTLTMEALLKETNAWKWT